MKKQGGKPGIWYWTCEIGMPFRYLSRNRQTFGYMNLERSPKERERERESCQHVDVLVVFGI